MKTKLGKIFGTFGNNRGLLHPGLISILFFGSLGLTAVGTYLYHKKTKIHQFPPEIAYHLRRALYYSSIGTNKDYGKALEYFKQAINEATKIKMDSSSNEFIGIRVQMANMLESMGDLDAAMCSYEQILKDIKYTNIDAHKSRAFISKMIVNIAIKLGQIQASKNYITEAEKSLTYGVETLMKEYRTSNTHEVLFTEEEVIAAYQTLGEFYANIQKPNLAVPLFLQCLGLQKSVNCHSVVLMNNIAAAIAYSHPEEAKSWAERAISICDKIGVTENECAEGKVVASYNLGNIEEYNGDFINARKCYNRAFKLAKKIKFEEGITQSTSALNNLSPKDRSEG